MTMGLSHQQLVSDLLHRIADLVQEADVYLDESDLFKSSVKPLPKPKAMDGPVSEPNKADPITNRFRAKEDSFTDRSIFRAKRERKQRSRYQKRKLVTAAPRKSFGSRMRDR